jgi:uncharacterized protein YjeT (DUF2065 family)
MWGYVLTGLALMLVLEGIFPFLSPGRWRLAMVRLIQRRDRAVRIMGLLSMAAGTVIMLFVHLSTLIN